MASVSDDKTNIYANRKHPNVSDKMLNHSRNTGKSIAEMEVGSHSKSLMSLGIFDRNEQPRGFSIEFAPDPELPDLIKSEITMRSHNGTYEYLIDISNNSAHVVSAEIKVL